MNVPSGRTLDSFDLDIIRMMNTYGFLRYSSTPIQLKSGVLSHVYVAGREDLTDHPNLMLAIGKKICLLLEAHHYEGDDRQLCLIGIPTAGTTLACAAALAGTAYETKIQPCCRLMREAKKAHGVHHHWIDGEPARDRHFYWLIDNVATNGASKFEAAAKLAEDRYPTKPPCFIWIDRQQGAVARLAAAGFKHVIVGYNLLDLAYALGELNLWPKEVVQAVNTEISAHQLP